jgi:lambda family phage portal protein
MARKKLPKMNALDRAISAIAPAWAVKRLAARTAMALAGGYAGGQYRDSTVYWQPGGGDADSDSITDLPELRNRSRDLVRNSPVAAGAIEADVSHVVGTGLTLQSRIDANRLGMDDDAAAEWQAETERQFAMWAESLFADAFGDQNFYELQDLAYRSAGESGDSFAVLAGKERAGWPHRLALQIIEADRVCNPSNGSDTETLVQGKERDQVGEAVAVHICSKHPGSRFGLQGAKWTRVTIYGTSGRRNVLHLYRKRRPGQTRGVPQLAPIIELVKQMTRYAEAEVDAAVNSAAMAVFTKMDPEAFQDLFDDEAQGKIISQAQKWDGTLGKGAAINLLPGEDVSVPTPGRPNPNFEPFFNGVLQQVGMALDIPHEVLTKRFQSSYSAARAALLAFWRTVRIRRAWLAARFCQPVYEEWLADAVALGIVKAPGFFADPMVRAAWSRAQWAGDGPGALDPLKEAQAAEKRMQIGVTTLPEEIVAYDGGDWEQKHAVSARVKAERVEAELEAPAAPAPGTPGMGGAMPAGKPGQPGAPKEEPPEPGEEDDIED